MSKKITQEELDYFYKVSVKVSKLNPYNKEQWVMAFKIAKEGLGRDLTIKQINYRLDRLVKQRKLIREAFPTGSNVKYYIGLR